MYQQRLEALRVKMNEAKLPQVLVTDAASIFYLTGKWIEAGERLLVLLVKDEGKPKLFINELFPEKETEDLEFVWLKDTSDAIGILSGFLEKEKPIGVDKNWPSGFLIRLMKTMGTSDVENSSVLLDAIRSIKDEEERNLMRAASKINDEAMHLLIESLEENMSELEAEELLKKIYFDLGAEGFSFTPIIAFDKNGANPHHENGGRLLKHGDAVILDIGCKKNHYCSDMTRTIFFGEAGEKEKEVFETVLEANKKAISSVRPGVRFSDIDRAARSVIEENGYGPYFTHRTGHSIGIEVHETGDVSSTNDDVLQPGMIFSVEPGIYLEGKFGVRIEDLVLVTDEGCEVLNSYPKELYVK